MNIKKRIIIFFSFFLLCFAVINFSTSFSSFAYATETSVTSETDSNNDMSDNDKGFFGGLFDSILNGIKSIFIPSEDFLTDYFNDLKSAFEEKIPFVSQSIELFQAFIDTLSSSDSEPPEFIITINDKKYNIVDFDTFNSYMPFVHSIILVVCYVSFIKKTIKRIPTIINNAPSESDSE